MAVSAFRGSPRSSHAEMAQMNITPLIDVMLVLLVIFMVTAPVLTGQLDLHIPQYGDASNRTAPPPQVALRVEAPGQFRLDGVAIGRAELPQALHELARNQPTAILQIGANADADYQGFAWMLAQAQRCGLRDIAWE